MGSINLGKVKGADGQGVPTSGNGGWQPLLWRTVMFVLVISVTLFLFLYK